MKRLFTILMIFMLLCSTGCTDMKKDTLKVTFYKAGKADAILLETDESAVLIDTGLDKNAKELAAQISSDHLDALIITHYDKDHVGGADAVIKAKDIDQVYVTYQSKESEDIDEFEQALARKKLSAQTVEDKVSFVLDGVSYTILGAGTYEKDVSNNSSLIVTVEYMGQTLLFTGDAEEERLAELTAMGIQADVLKVPYHGHYQKGLAAFLKSTSPSYAVITDSNDEPTQAEMTKTLQLLEEAGANVYETRYGTVTVKVSAAGITVKQ
ncbi:MAG: MBL fold metallo-hydrolase [Solobacterium sp.]|nr:MBL fold metallo-hydrolase [Solobacterium sp.]